MSTTSTSQHTEGIEQDAKAILGADANFAVYKKGGASRSASEPVRLLPAPPWRRFKGVVSERVRPLQEETSQKSYQYLCSDDDADLINAALLLRRPLLVTGSPGTGKSTLAFSIAHQLGLGKVLRWNITSRSTLKEGLYSYDVLQRLNDASLNRISTSSGDEKGGVVESKDTPKKPPLEEYIRLGPLGTALLPAMHPRVLLIDELDKSDIDLPNDLLHVFEEGRFEIPELKQVLKAGETVCVQADDSQDEKDKVEVGGHVECREFPLIVLTSNAEREFPPAFLRRCIRLNLKPSDELIRSIARSHLSALLDASDDADKERIEQVIGDFLSRRQKGTVANDQLLNALYMVAGVSREQCDPDDMKKIVDTIISQLNRSGS